MLIWAALLWFFLWGLAYVVTRASLELFRDPEFQEVIKTKDTAKILSHPKLASLMSDPEIAQLAAKLKPQDFSVTAK